MTRIARRAGRAQLRGPQNPAGVGRVAAGSACLPVRSGPAWGDPGKPATRTAAGSPGVRQRSAAWPARWRATQTPRRSPRPRRSRSRRHRAARRRRHERTCLTSPPPPLSPPPHPWYARRSRRRRVTRVRSAQERRRAGQRAESEATDADENDSETRWPCQ